MPISCRRSCSRVASNTEQSNTCDHRIKAAEAIFDVIFIPPRSLAGDEEVKRKAVEPEKIRAFIRAVGDLAEASEDEPINACESLIFGMLDLASLKAGRVRIPKDAFVEFVATKPHEVRASRHGHCVISTLVM